MEDIFTGLRRAQAIQAGNEAASEAHAADRARAQRDIAANNANAWQSYAMDLEELVIELGSRLEAATALVEQILRAANGEPVEHADKLLAADAAGEAARQAILKEVQETSKTGMAQAHQERLKVVPDATRKSHAIEKIYSPQSERFAKIWENFTKVRASRGDGPITQADAIKMRELLLEIGPELIAANNLTLRLLAEGNGQQVPEKLMPADQRAARREYLDAQAGNSRTGMIDASVDEIANQVSMAVQDSVVARQQVKIAQREATPGVPARGKKM